MSKPIASRLVALVTLASLPQAALAFTCADAVRLSEKGVASAEIVRQAEADGKDLAFVQQCLATQARAKAESAAKKAAEEARYAAEEEHRKGAEAAERKRVVAEYAARESMDAAPAPSPRPRPVSRRPAAPPMSVAPSPAASGGMGGLMDSDDRYPTTANTESYQDYGVNGFVLTEKDGQSTFSVDVDTASYAIARSKLEHHGLPPESAVRVEEFVNAFDYTYAMPKSDPFAVHLEASPHPQIAGHHVLRVGIQGRTMRGPRKPVHLTFLVDVSGSMSSPNKLPLAQKALHELVDNLGPEDTVALATYAGRETIVLQPTFTTRKAQIHAAIEDLRSGGGTSMGSGMELAYKLAKDNYLPGCENRVIVLSDGDANIGKTSHDQILASIRKYADEGITMTTIGLGMGNYKDVMMEQLANKGDGNYFYLDSEKEAKKVFGEKLSGTIETIARDVKIQVEFDPDAVRSYRLLGYENRDIADKDFRNDAVDAGEVGSGHQVTALYELVLADDAKAKDALATVRLRAKPPGPDAPAKEYAHSVPVSALTSDFEEASPSTRMAFAVGTFAEKLRGSPYVQEVSWGEIAKMARDASQGTEEHAELIRLIERAAELDRRGGVAVR